MKISTWNVNGIRAVVKKGFFDYLHSEKPDVLCIQETKADKKQLTEEILSPKGYKTFWSSAEKKGYSGVALFTSVEPKMSITDFGIKKFDEEGRVIQADFDDFILFNVYFPNGQKDDQRLKYKMDFYEELFEYINQLKNNGKNVIVCGDYNTAHKPIDLANPKANEKNSGFLPQEREWLDKIVDFGYVDVFREFNKEPENYTWWSYRFGARKRNIGWRIDYFFVNKEFMPKIKNCVIQSDVMGSDHCPVLLEIEIDS